MAKGDIEAYHEDGFWKNRAQAGQRASNTAESKADAQATGRQMAIDRGVEHVVKKLDGTIGECNTYPRSATRTRRRDSRTRQPGCRRPCRVHCSSVGLIRVASLILQLPNALPRRSNNRTIAGYAASDDFGSRGCGHPAGSFVERSHNALTHTHPSRSDPSPAGCIRLTGQWERVTSYVVEQSESGHRHVMESVAPFEQIITMNNNLLVDLPVPTVQRHLKSRQRDRESTVPAGPWRVIRKTQFNVRSSIQPRRIVAD